MIKYDIIDFLFNKNSSRYKRKKDNIMTVIEPKIDEIIFNQNTVELIIAHLKECCQIDFNYYKREFLERRIKARMYRLNMMSDLDRKSVV